MHNVSRPFQAGVFAACAAVAALLFVMNFVGAVALPPKPPRPVVRVEDVKQMFAEDNAMPKTWATFLDKDADRAGIPAPSVAEMSVRFPYLVDKTSHTLEVGKRVDVAGLRIGLVKREQDDRKYYVIEVLNESPKPKAFRLKVSTNYSLAECDGSTTVFDSRTVVLGNSKVSRNECVDKRGLEVTLDQVETVELPELAAYYVSRVPANIFGMDHRQARAHKPVLGGAPCSVALPNAVRVGFENGAIAWRDLVDFYARHRCDSYQFPDSYRAFDEDGEMALPAVAPQ